MSEALTRGVRVQVAPQFHPDRSNPAERYWFFSYTVRIANEGSEPVRLLARHWIITDANGEEQHVEGPGVVGQQPYLQPGEDFEYTSYCPLRTSLGSMHGTYRMVLDDGREFDAEIAPFVLADPEELN